MGLQAEVTRDLDSDADDVRQRRPTSQLDPGTLDMRSTPTWRCCRGHLWVQGTRASPGRRVEHSPPAALLTSGCSSTETTLAPIVNVGVLVPRPRVFRSHTPSRLANAARSTRWRATVATAVNCCQWAVIDPRSTDCLSARPRISSRHPVRSSGTMPRKAASWMAPVGRIDGARASRHKIRMKSSQFAVHRFFWR